MSEEASVPAADTSPVRDGAAAFIFVTILLDMLALGLILLVEGRATERVTSPRRVTKAVASKQRPKKRKNSRNMILRKLPSLA